MKKSYIENMIQRTYAIILLMVMAAANVAARDFTYTYEGQTLVYTVIDEDAKTCQTRCWGCFLEGSEPTGELIIPEIANDGSSDFKVVEIGQQSFYECSLITSVVIPNSVTMIGAEAFNDCSSLTSIEIPNSATSIRYRAFMGCSSLTSVEIPNSVTQT